MEKEKEKTWPIEEIPKEAKQAAHDSEIDYEIVTGNPYNPRACQDCG
jgi:hypothetical protein